MRAITGLAVFAALVAASPAGAQEGLRQRVDTTITLAEGGTLNVNIYSGRVNVTGARGSSVRVRGTADRDEISIRARTNSVAIRMEHGGTFSRADLDITVPIGTRVVLEGFAAAFSVTGVRGEANIQTLSGSIVVKDAEGKVSLESVSGDIDADGIRGDVSAESVNGTVSVRNVDDAELMRLPFCELPAAVPRRARCR